MNILEFVQTRIKQLSPLFDEYVFKAEYSAKILQDFHSDSVTNSFYKIENITEIIQSHIRESKQLKQPIASIEFHSRDLFKRFLIENHIVGMSKNFDYYDDVETFKFMGISCSYLYAKQNQIIEQQKISIFLYPRNQNPTTIHIIETGSIYMHMTPNRI